MYAGKPPLYAVSCQSRCGWVILIYLNRHQIITTPPPACLHVLNNNNNTEWQRKFCFITTTAANRILVGNKLNNKKKTKTKTKKCKRRNSDVSSKICSLTFNFFFNNRDKIKIDRRQRSRPDTPEMFSRPSPPPCHPPQMSVSHVSWEEIGVANCDRYNVYLSTRNWILKWI